MDQKEATSSSVSTGLNPVEIRSVELFREGAKLLGLPKSMGEIYGLMYVSQSPMSLDDLVRRLGISKGSASQGITFLKQLGAVAESQQAGERKMHYQAAVEIKSLIAGFIKSEIRPHLDATQGQISHLRDEAANVEIEEDREFYEERIERLHRWTKRAKTVLPLIQTVMGG